MARKWLTFSQLDWPGGNRQNPNIPLCDHGPIFGPLDANVPGAPSRSRTVDTPSNDPQETDGPTDVVPTLCIELYALRVGGGPGGSLGRIRLLVRTIGPPTVPPCYRNNRRRSDCHYIRPIATTYHHDQLAETNATRPTKEDDNNVDRRTRRPYESNRARIGRGFARRLGRGSGNIDDGQRRPIASQK